VISQQSTHPIPTVQNGAMNNPTQESRIRLVLLEDRGLFRASLGRFLASEPDFEVVGECGTSAEALEVLKGSTVDVVLLDFDVGTEHGSDFISAARQAGYQSRFLILAGSADVRSSAIALKLGASGIFLKTEAPDRLVQAIRLVGDGGTWLDPRIIQLLADQLVDSFGRPAARGSGGPLEERERSVLLGILGGLTNRKIGNNMGLSESSVKYIVQQLFVKASVRTRSQLVRVALEGSLGATHEFTKRQPNEQPNGTPPKSPGRRPTSASPSVDKQSNG